jgi:subfamily B ATP-binding cassette protein MsbA
MHEFQSYAALAVGLIAAIAVSAYFRSSLAQNLAARLQHHLRKRLFFHIQRLSMSFFQRHHAGALGSRVSSDIAHAGVVVDKGLIQLTMDGTAFILMAVIMVWMNPALAIVTIVLLSANGAVLWRYAPSIRRTRRTIQESQSWITGRAAEIFAGISMVKAHAGEDYSGKAFSKSSRHVRDLQFENSHLQGSFQALSNALVLLAQVAVVFLGTYLVVFRPDSLTKGQLVAFLLYVSMVNGAVQRLTDSMLQIQDGFAALERISDILTILPEPREHPHAVSPVLNGHVRFQRVTFGYRNAPVIRDLSCEFRPGGTYALAGPSGGGKSTLMQLLLRFYDPQSGRITIDGHDLRQISGTHYRSHVAAVLQDPIIFSGSVAENIGFASEGATREEIEEAARKAQAHDFILELPDGYETPLGERGVTLSGGQRQRIAIARALMRDPKLLVLDEATSSLDTLTEQHIQEIIDALRGSRTIIVIAHRLSTIRNVDHIYVMDQGRIVEQGNHDELMARNGFFKRLSMRQKGRAA